MEYKTYLNLPKRNIEVDTGKKIGPFEWWRHSIGHGGVNSLPLPEKVVYGSQKLKPRLVRTFIQEFFLIYPEHGTFDWSKLDPYMDALSRTGADVVASITIKPKILFPQVDQTIWKPNNVEEWQKVIYELVKRYSVDKKIVTYWEIGNETDIGEWGACPYLIKGAEDYLEYYQFTVKPILEAFPTAKIGGPAIANAEDKLFFDFIDRCYHTGTQLDFVSWHLYSDDPAKHQYLVERAKKHLEKFGQNRPEMLVTEWNKLFDKASLEELSQMPRRAAAIAAMITAMMDAGLDWSFYYHVWDQAFYPKEFETFYQDMSIMIEHWNEVPHRFGLFGVSANVRPQYFVYQMLSRMGDDKVEAHCDDSDLWMNAVIGEGQIAVMFANYHVDSTEDKAVTTHFRNLPPGRKELKVYRIDEKTGWTEEDLELIPNEHREIDTVENYQFRLQTYCPADSVTCILLKNID